MWKFGEADGDWRGAAGPEVDFLREIMAAGR
jgi:hypothetical protein